MHVFTLTTENHARCALLLKDKNISVTDIKRKCNLHSMCLYRINSAIKKTANTHPAFTPFTDNVYSSNTHCLMHFFSLTSEGSDDSHEDVGDDEDSLYTKCFIDYNEQFDFPREALYWVLTGGFVISLFEDDFVELDWKRYGFSDPYTLYYALGAYLHNIAQNHDERITSTPIINNTRYTFPNNLNGDFRFKQYDCSSTTLNNPYSKHECDEQLPFGLPVKKGELIGYHSVEMSFFAGLLLFAKNTNTPLTCINNTEQFLSQFNMKEHKQGNFGDAGMFSRGASRALVVAGERLPTIFTEFESAYNPVIEGGALQYIEKNYSDESEKLTGFIILPNTLNAIIEQLFRKIHNGNGRSSLAELIEGLNFYIEQQASI